MTVVSLQDLNIRIFKHPVISFLSKRYRHGELKKKIGNQEHLRVILYEEKNLYNLKRNGKKKKVNIFYVKGLF